MCKFILYSFWKNAVLTLLLFYYTFLSGFSGTSMFDGYVWTSFNVILFFPIIATGVFDRDVEDHHALRYPKLYENGRLGLDLNMVKMTEMLLSSLVHSLIIFGVMWYAFDTMDTMHANDYYGFGTSVFTWLIVAMNYRVVFITTTINWVFAASVLVSFGTLAMFLGIYCRVQWLSPWMYNVDIHMVQDPLFWIGLLAVPGLAIMVDSFKAWLLLEFLPDRKGLVLERVSLDDQYLNAPPPAPPPPAPPAATATAEHANSDAGTSGGGAGSPTARSSSRPMSSPKALQALQALQWTTRQPLAVLRSSFTFDHPDSGARRMSFVRHARAGDTSLVDLHQPAATPQAPVVDVEAAGGIRKATSRKPSSGEFSQQAMPHFQNVLTWRRILWLALATGVLLLLLGILVKVKSNEVVQFSVQYDGKYRQPTGTSDSELFYQDCPLGNSCVFNVTVPEDMAPPIAVVYEVTPFYQNYYSYQTSVVFAQLTGDVVDENAVAKVCISKPSRETSSGDAIFPCGLVATSVFNDTIEFASEVDFNDDDPRMTWDSDYDRFQNPPDYPTQPSNASWLYDRYPAVTDVARGVKSRRFVDWMFPSFFGYVRNPYGVIDSPLKKGKQLMIRINASFPVASLDAEKRFLLTTRNGLGGRHALLGSLLIFGSGVCFVLAIAVVAINKWCPRPAGKPRFRQLAHGFTSDWEPPQPGPAAASAAAAPPAAAAASSSSVDQAFKASV